MEIENFDDLLEKLEKSLSDFNRRPISRSQILDALLVLYGDDFGVEHPVNIWDTELSYVQAFDRLSQFDFEIFSSPVQADLEIDRDILFQTKVRIKAAGHLIIIHKYDKDPFPSNPHGHIIDQNLKIDLGNGGCFRNRNLVATLKKKKLLEIREKAKSKFKGDLPPLEI